jgi:Tfp pilus assembly protein PilF
MQGYLVLIGIFSGVVTLIIITRPFTVLFHELGHAIPAMLLTKQGASIYIGSYGNEKESFKITIGKLKIWLRYNPVRWRGGLCTPEAKNVSLTKKLIYILCGPLFSLCITAILFYLALSYNLHGSIKLICAFALGSTILDLIVSLYPHQIKTSDGKILFSDGYLLFYLQKLKKFPNEYADAVERYENKEYDKTAVLFENFINRGLVSEDVYRCASTSYIFIKNYEKGYQIQKEFESKYDLNSNDYYNLVFTSTLLKLNEERDLYLNKSLEKNPANPYSLNVIAYDLNNKGKFEEAILILDKVIAIQDDFAYAYNNRGHAKIEIGKLDEGLTDIQHSLELDNQNSYAYRNLGIYHPFKNENEQALKYFLQSKEMDKDTDFIDEYISKVTVSKS